MRLRRPLPFHGRVKDRWQRHHEYSRSAVMKRSHGVCEAPGCFDIHLDWCHLFGRRHIIEEPWCSTPELTVALCRTHHNEIDRNINPDLKMVMRAAALVRLSDTLGVPIPSGVDQAQAVREMIAQVDISDDPSRW